MNFESLKERLFEQLHSTWERIQESDTYIQLKERYHNLSPSMQKIVLTLVALTFALFVLLPPTMLLLTSSESVATFEGNVNLLRNLYRVQRELSSLTSVPEPAPSSQISTQVRNLLNQAGLAPEQIQGPREIQPERDPQNALQPDGVIESGIEITLLKLNVRQVVDIGTRLSQMGQGLYLTGLDLKVNNENDHYFDVIFRVTGFSVPGTPASATDEAS